MNPWGTMNDWLRFEAAERAARYGAVRQSHRSIHRTAVRAEEPSFLRAAEAQTVPSLNREDLTACA